MREVPAVLVASNPTYSFGEFLPIDTWGGKTWGHIVASQGRAVGDIQWSANQSANDYDTLGVGKPGTPGWGWALCDGQSSRPDMVIHCGARPEPA